MGRIVVTLALVLLVGFGGVALSGCKNKGKDSSTATAGKCEACAKLMADGEGWCENCGKGMKEGKEVICFGCYTKGAECSEHKVRE